MAKSIRLLTVFSAGALLGTAADFLHFVTRTDGYPSDQFRLPIFGTPVWVPFLFGSATVVILYGNRAADAWLGRPAGASPMSGSKAAASLLCFLAVYAISAFAPASLHFVKDLILFALSAAIWWGFDRTATGVARALLTVCGGLATEWTLVRAGCFFYYPESATWMGVPSWLPWLYASASVALGALGRVDEI